MEPLAIAYYVIQHYPIVNYVLLRLNANNVKMAISYKLI